MMSPPARLERAFLHAAQAASLLAPGDRVLVALSGGADSVALLHLLRRTAAISGIELCAAHLDHALRPESGEDAAFVAGLCARLGIELVTARREVAVLAAEMKVGLEEAGRAARREFLLDAAARRDCGVIALGHHRGDQAETVIHHLLRGCGVSGLAAMRPRSAPFIRPLLPFTRQELRDYLAALGEGFVEDASNCDPVFTRNRIRHQVIPALTAFNPQLEEGLARLADCAATEEDYWETEVRRLEAELVPPGEREISLVLAELAALHPALRRRFLRQLLSRAAERAEKEIGYLHVMAVERLLGGAAPQGELDLPGLWVGRRYDRLLLRRARPTPSPGDWELRIERPGRYRLPTGSLLRVEVVPTAPPLCGRYEVDFPAALLGGGLMLRPWRPGDRIRLPGLAGRKRIKELLAEERLPLEERQRAVVVATEADILWVCGLRRCDGYRPPPGEDLLRLRLESLKSPEMA